MGVGNARMTELRPAKAGEVDIWFEAIVRNMDRLRQWLPWANLEFQRDDIGRYLAEREKDNAERIALTAGIWCGEELCGAIGLHRIDQQNRSTSIGYWLESSREGQGLMTGAVRTMVTEGFQNFGLHRIEIRCATGNQKSCAIPRRLGFVEEGILREAERLGDRWVDLRVFSMLEGDWDGTSTGLPGDCKSFPLRT